MDRSKQAEKRRRRSPSGSRGGGGNSRARTDRVAGTRAHGSCVTSDTAAAVSKSARTRPDARARGGVGGSGGSSFMLVALGRDEAACLRLHRAAAAILAAAAADASAAASTAPAPGR